MSVLGAPWSPRPEPWMGEAVCKTVDPQLFHAEKGEVQKVRQAKLVCAGCPVREACAEWGLRVDDRYAILGGFSERDRRRLKRGEVVVFNPPKRDPYAPPKGCLHCGDFVAGHHNRRYCSDKCRVKVQRGRQNESRRLARAALRKAAA